MKLGKLMSILLLDIGVTGGCLIPAIILNNYLWLLLIIPLRGLWFYTVAKEGGVE